MRERPELDPDVDDHAPTADVITAYDEAHFITYLRLLDAEQEGADWQDVSMVVLHRDPIAEAERTRSCWCSHLDRARWMTSTGYRKLLERAAAKARPKLR